MSIREELIRRAKGKKSGAGEMVFESIKSHKEGKKTVKRGNDVKTESRKSNKK